MDVHHHNRNSVVAGVLLLGLGLLLLVGQTLHLNLLGIFDIFHNWNLPYPIYIIVPGLFMTVVGVIGGRTMIGFTILGSIILISGGVLAFQEITNSYQTWAYLWALVFPGSIGLALTLQSITTPSYQQRKTGLNLLVIALAITLVGWSFFEGAIHLSGYEATSLPNIAGPLLLIGIGGWLLLRHGFSQREL